MLTPVSSLGSDDPRLLHVPSPDWRDQVMYMILTDRFADGDPSNNDLGHGEFRKGSPSHYNGGDLKGITGKVPYLKDLGVTAVWITPPVLNQWWSTPYAAAGWHGYWAVDFSKVDPHMGTLEDYKDLSHALHRSGMYLIQDIVANHVGNFYTYDGEYDPEDTARGFRLLEPDSIQPVPEQYPFNLIDRLNPEHAAADIYHWTPTVQDFTDPVQEKTYMLGMLADINTRNPLVLETFKQTYSWWIEEVGVDAFRIDTVMLADFSFWHHFLNDPDGIHARAHALGKSDFLTFGESFSISAPFETSGEEKIVSYIGSESMPGVKSMLAFPLYASLSRVFAEGKPTAELQHRVEAFMETFPDPHRTPTFIDNHDTRRFLGIGSGNGFEQALTTLFTLPGIPVLLQGTEQGLRKTRQTLFAGGYGTDQDQFDQGSRWYRTIARLARLRRENPVFSRGSVSVLAADPTGAGIFAYRRTHGDEQAIVLINTAPHSIWVPGIDTGIKESLTLNTLYRKGYPHDMVTDPAGRLSAELPAHSIVVATTRGAERMSRSEKTNRPATIEITTRLENRILAEDLPISGTISEPGTRLRLVVDGDLDSAIPFKADDQGRWTVLLPVRDFGEADHHLQAYAPELRISSPRIPYRSAVSRTDMAGSLDDPKGDDRGPTGEYRSPAFYTDTGQKDILRIDYQAGGANLILTLKMRGLTRNWVPFNGMEKVAFSIFFDLPDQPGQRQLPLLNSSMPDGMEWNLGHILNGWGNSMFNARGADARRRGENLSYSPSVSVDAEARTIRITYRGKQLGLASWHGVGIYLTTWDVNGEGDYVPIRRDAPDSEFSGGDPDAPRIMDDAVLRLPPR